jgi:hypothetical protein
LSIRKFPRGDLVITNEANSGGLQVKRERRTPIDLGRESVRQSGPAGVAGRKHKGFVNAGVVAATLLDAIKKRRDANR